MTMLDDALTTQDDAERDCGCGLTADAGEHTGAMIALVPTEADLDRLALDPAIEGAEPREELHLTLFYLGDATDIPIAAQEQITSIIAAATEAHGALTGRGFGVNLWNPESESPAWVIGVGDTEPDMFAVFRHRIGAELAGVEGLAMPQQHTPWAPHVCVAYSSATDLVAKIVPKLGEITFDRVRVAFAGEVTDISLQSATVLASSEGAGMPWHVTKSSECAADTPWAVVKDDDGSVEGCHATEAEANEQMRALYSSEDDAAETKTAGGKPSEGTKKDKRLAKNKYEAGEPLTDFATWEGVIVVEGVTTGDGREFAAEALTWADPPLTLRWKKEDAHGGDHDVTVAVGRIDEVWRDGGNIIGRGVVDLGQPDGAEAARRLGNETLRGISIDADDITNADIEMIWPEDNEPSDDDSDADVLMKLFSPPEKVIYHAGRIRAATLCDIPAFVEAYIKLTDAAGEPPLAASVTPPVVEATSDGAWDAGVNEIRLPDLMTHAHALAAYAWVDTSLGAELGRGACRFIHHEIAEDGTVGLANLTACSSAISTLNHGRVDLSTADRRATYNHLAKHLRDAGREPEPFSTDQTEGALVAHAVEATWRPPRSWFSDPKLGQLIPIMVTDDGQVYGHAAQWGLCHIGYGDQCVQVPKEEEFPYFLTGELACDDGTTVAVGQITVDTGHAPLYARAQAAAEHYDNTGAVVADVTLGNDAHGIWVAGAIRPDADHLRVHKLRASGQVSPDWRRIGGQLRMVALLTVNGSGYQVPKMRARVASLGAASETSEVQALVAAGTITVGGAGTYEPTEEELNKRALRLFRENLARKVHPEKG